MLNSERRYKMNIDKNEFFDHSKKTVLVYQNGYPPLDIITLPTIPTNAAAYYLNRQPQTLRVWACLENGPIRPIRINGRLAWPVAIIRNLLAGGK